jgi:ATP-binding cassette subfamily B protein
LPIIFSYPYLIQTLARVTRKSAIVSQPRILAYDPDILILDEATSNIDPVSESLIQNAIKKITKDRSSTILNCDRILVLSKGEKVEEGTHETLMRAQGLYNQLYKLYLKKEKT